MKHWVGAAIVASICAIAAPASATAGGQTLARSQQANTTDFSAQRHDRSHHRHHTDRAYGPYVHYLARPYYYRPYPYASPAPFSFGFGFGPYW